MIKNMSRKALSDVVTTVLIILLVLAAVVIIWAFIKPALQEGGKSIQGQTSCFGISVEITSCNKSSGAFIGRVVDGDPKYVRVAATQLEDNKVKTAADIETGALGSFTGTIAPDSNKNISSMVVAGIIEKDGQKYTCPASLPTACKP